MKKNKRAISSIIGSMFVVILTAGALSATLLVLEQQERATTEMAQETTRYLDGLSEKIEIRDTKTNNGKLNLTLANAGDSIAQVKSIYVVNETALPKEQYRYDVDYLVDGRETVTNVGQELDFVVVDAASYTIRVVTESGNSVSAVYSQPVLTSLPLSLSVIPPTVTTGENVTLLYTITNNLPSPQPLSVSPIIGSSVECEGSQVCTTTKLIHGPNTVVIEKGSFAIIKETYKVEGPPGTIVTFNASYMGAGNGNYVVEEAKVIVVSSTFSLSTGKATKPDIYLLIPSPFGDSNQRGLWGTVIVNPTNSTMKVSRVLMTVFTASHTSDVVINECGSSSSRIVPIAPSTSSEWDCPHNNQIQWKDVINPEILQPGEAKSFLVRVQPGNLNIEEEPGATVTATVYTDIGIFTKAGYTTSMVHQSTEFSFQCFCLLTYRGPLVNVYLTDTTNTGTGTSGALNNINMFGHMNNISPSTSTTFHVAMADFDTDIVDGGAGTQINSGARLIINVPPGFSNVNVVSHDKFLEPTVSVRLDGIIQIIGTTNEHIGNSGQEAAVIAFTATTPSPSQDSTYIMQALIDGTTNSDPPMSIGAIAEIALQVNGTS